MGLRSMEGRSAHLLYPTYRCYHTFNTSTTWLEGNRTCSQYGYILATVDSNATNQFLIDLGIANGLLPNQTTMWIGLSYYGDKPGDLTWANGSNATFVNWAPGN